MKKRNLMLLRAIQHSKGSFMAAVAMIAVGLSLYMAMSMVVVNLEDALSDYYHDKGFPDIFIEATHISPSQVKKAALVDGVAQAQGRMKLTVPFITEAKERVNVTLLSYENQQSLNQLRLIDGQLLGGQQDDCLVLQQFVDARGLAVGDRVEVQINGRVYSLRISGTVESPEFVYLMENAQSMMPNPSQYGIIYVHEDLAAQAFGLNGAYNELLVTTQPRTDLSQEQILTLLEKRLTGAGVTQSILQKDQLSNRMMVTEFTSLRSMCAAIPIIFLGAAAVILAMMLGRMVKQDRSRIGIMKAIGYTGGQVLHYYLKYAMLAGLAGGLVGIVGSFAIAHAMLTLYMDFFRLPYDNLQIYYSYCLSAVLLTIVFCGGAGIFGARGAMQIMPAQSMQAEVPKAGRHILLERLPFIWKRCSFTSKLIFKNIFRNKMRSLFQVLGMAVSFSLMLFSLSMPEIMDDLMNGQFSEFMTMDYNLSFYQPVAQSEIEALQHYLPDSYVEGKLEYPFFVSHGHKEKAIALIGLQHNTRFYHFQDSRGYSVELPSKGLLLTENAASLLRVKVGDHVMVQSYLDEKEYTVPVAGIIQQTLGMNGYLSMDYMGRLFIEPQVVNGAMLDSANPEVIQQLREVSGISSILSNQDMMGAYASYTELIDIYVVFLVLLSGSLGFCIIYNATIVGLNEREREFSSLRVQGFTIGEIFRLLLRESFLLSVLGCLVGIPLSLLLCSYSGQVFSNEMYTLKIQPSAGTFVLTILCALVFILVSQLITYKKISGLDFLQALKNRV